MLRFVPRSQLPSPLPYVGDYPEWLCRILVSRGVDSPEKADAFLHPSTERLHPPMLMQDMQKAVSILLEAKDNGTRVAIYGDYDVDGMCASSIMIETCKAMGIAYTFYIPSRQDEGYGLNKDAIRVLSQSCGVLFTVDCGITNHEEVRLARSLGMRVIVTDHHQLAPTPSPADAVLNPLLGGYPFRRLCGAGVALKVCHALLGTKGLNACLPLAALATVADLVPLIDENRVIVTHGLAMIPDMKRPGISALMEKAGIKDIPTSTQVAFQLAPRLNAVGRMASAVKGVELLTTDDPNEAASIAAELEEENTHRRKIEAEIVAQAIEQAEKNDFVRYPCLIVEGDDWNPGIIGLAAGKLAEKYHCVTIALSHREDGFSVGSARSIRGINLHEMLSRCSSMFVRFGGHEMAAGLTIRTEDIPKLREVLNFEVLSSTPEEVFFPLQEYDAEINDEDLSLDTVRTLNMLAPFGEGNPNPVFLMRDCNLISARAIGKDGNTLSLNVLGREQAFKCIWFGHGTLVNNLPSRFDLAFAPDANTWNGSTTLQLQVKGAEQSTALWRERIEKMPEWRFAEEFAKGITSSDIGAEKAGACDVPVEISRGELYIAHCRKTAVDFLSNFPDCTDVAIGAPEHCYGYPTFVILPVPEKIPAGWSRIVLLDGEAWPGEASRLREKCDEVVTLPDSDVLLQMRAENNLTDEQLRAVYVACRGGYTDLSRFADAVGLSLAQSLTALCVLEDLRLITFTDEPFNVTVLPVRKCKTEESRIVRYYRTAQ